MIAGGETTRIKVRTKHEPPAERPYLRCGLKITSQWQCQDVDGVTRATLEADPHLRVENANAGDPSFPDALRLADVETQNSALREENAKLRTANDALKIERDKLTETLESVTLPAHDGPQRPDRQHSRAAQRAQHGG